MIRSLVLLAVASCVAADPAAAATQLIQRVVGSRAAEFTVVIVPATGNDRFAVKNGEGGKIELSGNTAGSVGAALNWYLKYFANCQMTWSGDNLHLPTPLPKVPNDIAITRPYKYGYYENVCTVSYSMAWWEWDRWEREIDWMAMNGINMPLAFTGQEYVWEETFKDFGLTHQDLMPFFSGPAFFAWQRMGNLKGWGGPLPEDFIQSRMQLQLQILQRMRNLGMTPVLPAFAGHIPEALTTKYNVSYTRSPDWGGFSSQYGSVFYLDNTDPLFVQIGKKFIEKQTAVYGTDHLYNADQYNEMNPPSGDLSYIKSASAAMHNSMAAADPQAVWVMQGWLFVSSPSFWTNDRIQAYLGSVPNDKMIILDLFSDVVPVYPKTQSYFGKPFIWNMLHNFGGNVGLYGMIETINTSPHDASNTSIVGVGITPEGTLQNYMVYDLMMENAWRAQPVNLVTWVKQYATRRYGVNLPGTSQAWRNMAATVFNATASAGWGVTKSVIEVRPELQMVHAGFMPTKLFYKPEELLRALKSLLSASDSLSGLATYQYDVVDWTRQALSNLMLELNVNHTTAFNNHDQNAMKNLSTKMLSVLSDFETLLASNEHFLLGRWLSDAQQWGKAKGNPAYYDWNARNQVTLWGPKGEITDYASKQWSGLVKDYYKPRWELYLSTCAQASASGSPFPASTYSTQARALEEAWQHGTQKYPTQPTGNPVTIATGIVNKYFS
eukprot:TRINITY_DN17307_c0_g2_i1.p1 TRINITY_DN17307_c0_g2~~TRINITY_DN17307_c0_g2_i1.p1  ORF type:complete len:722 (+),score=146.96 TRINITY_DN17307_c0_g2_i1:36-2201(+)